MEYTVQDTHLDFSTDSGTTFKELYGMNKTPDMGAEPEKKEVSNMRDKNKRYVFGMQDTGTLGFEFYYNRDKTAEESGVLKNSFSELKKLEKAGEAVDWRLTFPDGSYYSWKGKPSVYIMGASVGDPIGFKLSVSVESEMEFTEGALDTSTTGGIDTSRGYATGMITSQVWEYHKGHTIKCCLPTSVAREDTEVSASADTDVAQVPARVAPKSQTEKRIDALEKGLQQCTTSTAIAPLTAYELLSDTSVKCNDITYTIETDSATGLISKITDSLGGKLVPTYKATPTDVDSHNFMLWAVAMARGLSSTYLEPIVIFNYGNIVGLNPDFSDYGVRSGDHFSVTDEEMVLTHFLTDSGLHANNYVAFHTPILNVGYTKLRVTYEVEKVHSDWNVFIIDAGYAVNENGYNIDDDFGYTELVIWTGNNVSVPKTTVDIDISESIGKEIYVGFRHNCNNSHIYSLALVQ